jgi:hypothetical protein
MKKTREANPRKDPVIGEMPPCPALANTRVGARRTVVAVKKALVVIIRLSPI